MMRQKLPLRLSNQVVFLCEEAGIIEGEWRSISTEEGDKLYAEAKGQDVSQRDNKPDSSVTNDARREQ